MKFTLKSYSLIQIFVSLLFLLIYVIGFSCTSVFILSSFPLICFVILVTLTILEPIIYKKNKVPVIRLTLMVISLLVSLLMFTGDITETDFTNLELMNFVLAIYDAAHVFIMLVYMLTKAINYDKENQNKSDGSYDINKKYLPIGYFSRSQLLIVCYVCTPIFILYLVTFGLLFGLTDLKILSVILIVIGFFLYLLSSILVNTRFTTKDFVLFCKDLDYSRLETEYTKILNSDDVHPETKNYIRILLASVFYRINKDKYELYSKDVKKPLVNGYIFTYNSYLANIYIYENRYEDLDNLIKEMEKTPSYQKKKSFKNHLMLIKQWKELYEHQKLDGSVEALLPTNVKNNVYSNVCNSYLRVLYYKKIEDQEHLNQEIKFINENGKPLEVLCSSANNLGIKEELTK